MGFSLDNVVPWGRSYKEYVSMFGLTEAELKLRLLGCGDGPASFNAEHGKRGGTAVSVDPLYALDAARIRARIAETYDTVMAQMRLNLGDYAWEAISSVEELGRIRMAAMNTFLEDYESGKESGRYIAGELPTLHFFKDMSFDIALSSHFLFLYSARLSAAFHLRALREMLRVAGQVRVFPLLTLDGAPSPHLAYVVEALAREGFDAEVRRVPYEFQRGGNEMLLVKPSKPCPAGEA